MTRTNPKSKMDNESTNTRADEPQSFQTQSPEINELAGALSLAQGEMSPAKKGASNTFFKSSYADLSEVIEASRYPLSSNDLSIVQYCDDGYVVTQLMHSSGQWLRGRLRITPKDNTPQGIGSALTYARRYSWQMMVGLGAEDDDGEAAMGRAGSAYDPAHAKPTPKKKAPAKRKAPAKKKEEPQTSDKHEPKTETSAGKKEETPTGTEAPKPPKLSLDEEVKAIVKTVKDGDAYLKFHDVDPDAIPVPVQERIMSKGLDGFGEMVAQWSKEREESA